MDRVIGLIRELKKKKHFDVIALSALTLFVLITACWLPLLFGGGGRADGMTLDKRINIFDAYISGGQNRYIESNVEEEELTRRQLGLCERMYKSMLTAFSTDVADSAVEGAEYRRITVESGESIVLWHAASSWKGKCENKAEIYLDAQTGDLYAFEFEKTASEEEQAEIENRLTFDYAASSVKKVFDYNRLDTDRANTAAFEADGALIEYRIISDRQENGTQTLTMTAIGR